MSGTLQFADGAWDLQEQRKEFLIKLVDVFRSAFSAKNDKLKCAGLAKDIKLESVLL